MITFIFEPDILPNQKEENISNGIGIDKNLSLPFSIISNAVRPNTIKDAINNTEGMQVKSLKEVDFSADDIYIYPIFTTEFLSVFGYTHEYESKYKFLDPVRVIIPAVFEFLPDYIIDKARKKELYIAVLSICEGKSYYSGWDYVKYSCNLHGISESQIIPVLCGDHREYEDDVLNFRKDYIHLNYYALELSYKIRKGYETILNTLSNEKKKHFICLNSQIKPHRYHLMSNIFNNDLINYGYVSCQSYESHVNNFSQIEGIYQMREVLRQDGANISEFLQFYSTLPYTVDSINQNNYTNALHSSWNHDSKLYNFDIIKACDITSNQIDAYYKAAVIDVITETALIGHDIKFLTEKTFKAIMYKMPFIISGDKGNNKELLRHGFKLYDMLFDYTFDDYESYVDRNNAIVKQLKKYCAMPLEEFVNRVQQDDVQKVIEHNFTMLKNNNVWQNFANDLVRRLLGHNNVWLNFNNNLY